MTAKNSTNSGFQVPPLTERLAPAFRPVLQRFGLNAVERATDSIYGIDTELRIAYYNPAYLRFAAENGGEPAITRDWGIGARLTDAFSEHIRPFFERGYADCFKQGRLWQLEYICSSDTTYRCFRQQVFPIDDRGVLIVNALLTETEHDPALRPPEARDPAEFVNDRGRIVQCAHCRFVQNPAVPELWEWVPNLVAGRDERVEQGMCDLCLEHFRSTGEREGP